MEFGTIFELSVPRPFAPGVEATVVNNALEQVQLADRLGYASAWCVEHHFLEEYSHSSCPDMFLAACAATTRRIRLGFGIATCVPEIHHPVRLAERGAFLDVLSGGRVEFGTGRSSTWTELGGFRAKVADTKKAWDEYVRVIPKMWMQERFRYEGATFSMPERNVLPKPVQKPHPPLWVAVNAPGTEIDAARRGMGCLTLSYGNVAKNAPRFEAYRRAIEHCEPVGAAINNRIAAVNWLYCHEDGDYARKRVRGAIHAFSSMAAQTLEVAQAYPTNNYGSTGLLSRLRIDPEDANAAKGIPDGLCAGTPGEIIETIRQWQTVGVDQLVFMLNAREVLSQEEVLASLHLFHETVMPAFAAASASDLPERAQYV